MRLYLIAGEASGDLHGSNLLKALYAQEPDLSCRVWGGDLMQNTGATLVKHYRTLAFMGFVEVAKNLRAILQNIAFCKRDILEFQPDALVLIDYPGFNLRIARWAKEQGIPVVYYISPQLWAWHASRAHAIRRDVDKLLVILPFEQEFFRKYGIEAEFVGHPLLDEIGLLGTGLLGTGLLGTGGVGTGDQVALDQIIETQLPITNKPITNKPIPNKPVPNKPVPNPPITNKPIPNQIALLPGSRKQEVSRILPRMLEVTAHFPEYQFVIAGARSLPEEYYSGFLAQYPKVRLVRGQTYEVLLQSKAALVKSGTSTLETALLDVPQVVCYAGNWLSYRIAKRLVKVKYISLVNLIMDRPMVRELIQDELNQKNLTAALTEILTPEKSAELRAGYAELRKLLGGGGASERAATAILKVAIAVGSNSKQWQ